jgi:hypothetical protein
MKFVNLLVIALIICACGHIEREIPVSDIDYIPKQTEALLLTEARISDAYDFDFDDAWTLPQVHWATQPCPTSGNPSVIYKGTCYAGLMWNCSDLYVAVAAGEDMTYGICNTALAHEFGHCLYVHMHGHGDGPHDDLEFWGLIDAIDSEICARGW